MQARIAQSVQTDPHRQEVKRMGQTIAEIFVERGRLQSRRETLLQAIRIRFGDPSTDVMAVVEACPDVAQLDAWFTRVLTARRLSEVGIKPQS